MFSQHEYCLLCSSLNKLLVEETDHAWECWNCNTRWWIDDQARLEWMLWANQTAKQAEWIINFSSTKYACISGLAKKELDKLSPNFCMIESNE